MPWAVRLAVPRAGGEWSLAPPVAALAARAGTFYTLPRHHGPASGGRRRGWRLGWAEQDLATKVALGTLLGLGRLMVTDLAAQLGATDRHRTSAQTPNRWTVGPLWRRCCPKGDSR